MKKYRVTVHSIRTEIYEVNASNKEQAEEMACGADGSLISDDCSDWTVGEIKEVRA